MARTHGETAEHYAQRRAFESERKNNPPQIDPRLCILEPLCSCLSWRHSHLLSAHKKLRGEWEWPTVEARESRERYREAWDTTLR